MSKIQPVKIDEKKYNTAELDPFVFPSLSVFIGHVASGKSTLLYNLIEMTAPVFNGNVILISPTLLNDPIQQKMIEDDMILEHYDFFNNDLMRNILDAIKEDKDEKYLIVFDDILSMTPKHMTKEGRWWNSYISQYRHKPNEGQVSLMFFLQYFKDLSPVIRSNVSYLGLLGLHSPRNIKSNMLRNYHRQPAAHSNHFMTVIIKQKMVANMTFYCWTLES